MQLKNILFAKKFFYDIMLKHFSIYLLNLLINMFIRRILWLSVLFAIKL